MYNEKILSIIIPTYHAEKFLEKCLDSFLIKEEVLFNKLQVIVVNDGSPDNSAEIAQRYMEQFPNVYELINKENGGHGSGINIGVKYAKGKYFKVIDADDWVDTKQLEQYIQILQDCDSDVVISDFRTYDILTKEEKTYHAFLGDEKKQYDLKEIMYNWLQLERCLTFHGITYRTQFYCSLNYKLAEKVFYEDQEYATIPMSAAKTVTLTGKCVYVYRIGDVTQSVSARNQVKRMKDLEQVIKKMILWEKNCTNLSLGGVDYWKKKTSMVVTSYYQIALLKNLDKRSGRKAVRLLNQKMKQKNTVIYDCVSKKCICFMAMSYLHISNEWYDKYAPKLITWRRKYLHVK